MGFNPGNDYHGDRYIYEGITGFGDEIEKAFERWNNNKKELEKADAAMQDMSQRNDPVTGEPLLSQDTIDYWRKSKRRASAYAGIKEAMGLAKNFSELQAGNEERSRDRAAFEQPVASYTDDQGVKHYVGIHTPRSSVTDLDARGGQGHQLTPNAVIDQANRTIKADTTVLKNYPLTSGLDTKPESLLDDSNPFGVMVKDSKGNEQFQATPKGSKQTHVDVGNGNILPVEEYKKLQVNAKRIMDSRKLIDDEMQKARTGGGRPTGGYSQRPLTPGVPVARNAAEAHRMIANGVKVYQTPYGQVYSAGGQPQQQGTPYNPGAEVRPAGLAPSPDEDQDGQ